MAIANAAFGTHSIQYAELSTDMFKRDCWSRGSRAAVERQTRWMPLAPVVQHHKVRASRNPSILHLGLHGFIWRFLFHDGSIGKTLLHLNDIVHASYSPRGRARTEAHSADDGIMPHRGFFRLRLLS